MPEEKVEQPNKKLERLLNKKLKRLLKKRDGGNGGTTIFVTADEHYFHKNIIKFCNRPFSSIEEMHETFITNHNLIVSEYDITIHVGDFSLGNVKDTKSIIKRLGGGHIFLKGSHDKWLPKDYRVRIEKMYDGNFIVMDHYCLRTWARSHYNSIHLFGHSHGKLESIGKSMDVGVDTNDYYPYLLTDIIKIMKSKPDNFNLVKGN